MRLLLLLLLLTLPAAATGTLYQSFAVDLDGDGKLETVGLKGFQQDGVRLGQLTVLSSSGRLLWAGPQSSQQPWSPSEPLVFGGDFDLGAIEVVGDLDGDGAVELLGTYQKSDLSPTRFRLLRWQDGKFVHLRSGNLVPADQRPGTFVWAVKPMATLWIDRFLRLRPDHTLLVRTVDAEAGKNAELEVRWTEEGFQVAH